MKIIRSVTAMRSEALRLGRRGKTIGLVPTMGALHAGHLSLVRRARAENGVTVVSIFVNPRQFGPNEDYLRYPRPFAEDRRACERAGVDYLFAPTVRGMYPRGYRTRVEVETISDMLCGAFRPGHFRGVTTVVAKLFNIVRPDRAYFGRKDYQQLRIVERMAADLNFPVRIVPCPIVREPSGLALSSRNRYLSSQERVASARISAALREARAAARGRRPAASRGLVRLIARRIGEIPGSRIDYIEVCHPETLRPLSRLRSPAVIVLAVWVGTTRLIDNILIAPRPPRR